MKKAQIEVSFNWIFILIAGFALLIFFYIIITNQTETSRETLSRTIVQRMNAVFDSMQANPNTAEVHRRVTFELDFTCINGVHEFRRGRSASSSYLDHSIIFTPERLGGSELITYTTRINLPFLTTSVLYLSDARTLYFFNETDFYYNLLDDQFEKAKGTFEEAIDKANNYRKVVFVTKLSELSSLSGTIPDNMVVVVIHSNYLVLFLKDLNEFNPNIFDDFDAEGLFLYGYTNEIVLGAIITGNYGLTQCNFEKINQSFERVKFVLNERIDNITARDDITQNCKTLMLENKIEHNFSNTNTNNYLLFIGNMTNLETVNRNLERLGCPTIY